MDICHSEKITLKYQISGTAELVHVIFLIAYELDDTFALLQLTGPRSNIKWVFQTPLSRYVFPLVLIVSPYDGVHRALNPDLVLTVPGVRKAKVPDDPLLPELPTRLHKRCAAGVNWPPTLGLLGNFGTGVASTLPDIPIFEDSRFVLAFVSTIR